MTCAQWSCIIGRAWDAVVVGAGPAGAVAARELARRGASVCLLDKARFPRAKPCGGCISHAALAALEQIGLGRLVEEAGAVPLRRLDLAVGGVRPAGVKLILRGGAVLSRERFDAALVDAAVEAGAVFLDDAAAKLGCVDGDYRRVQIQHDGDVSEIRGRVVIAADGLGGTLLRDEPELQPRTSAQSYIGAAITLPGELMSTELSRGVIQMTCGKGGYVGAVQLGTGELHLAAALDPRLVRSMGGPGAAAVQIMRAGGRRIADSAAIAKWRGTTTLTRRRARLESERLLVIGDAAGYVEPFTGEGMAWAIMSGIAVAPIALDVASGRRAGEWERVHAELIAPRQRGCRGMAWVLRRPRLVRGAVWAATVVPVLASPVLWMLERPPVFSEAAVIGGRA